MASVKAAKKIGGGFSNGEEIVKVIYDFAKDAGAVGALTLCTAQGNMLVTGFLAVVKTTCTSGGLATVQVGDTGDDDRYLTATAVASLTADAVFGENGAFDQGVKLADGEVLAMKIAVAALTAGKIEVTFKTQRI